MILYQAVGLEALLRYWELLFSGREHLITQDLRTQAEEEFDKRSKRS